MQGTPVVGPMVVVWQIVVSFGLGKRGKPEMTLTADRCAPPHHAMRVVQLGNIRVYITEVPRGAWYWAQCSVPGAWWFLIVLAASSLGLFVLAVALRAMYLCCRRRAAAGRSSTASLEEREIERALLQGTQPCA